MRKFIRDVILRSADMIREKEKVAESSPAPGTTACACRFCGSHDHLFQVMIADPFDDQYEFACGEHLGPLIADWMIAPEVMVVRL